MIQGRDKPHTFTPDLQLQTLFTLNSQNRIISTREPNPSPGPAFALIRSRTHCAWALRADVPEQLARELNQLAGEERLVADLRDAPLHASKYESLVGGEIESGPAFIFPDVIHEPVDTVVVEDVSLLERNFRGWDADEIPGRSPVLALVEEDGQAMSVCFCARLSDVAAEVGLETALAFRGRGLAARVTAAWALKIRASKKLPVYSTSWNNEASLAIARKLRLIACASDWSISGRAT